MVFSLCCHEFLGEINRISFTVTLCLLGVVINLYVFACAWFSQIFDIVQVDTIFMMAATIYITQLLFFTWALADQQSEKWPLFGYMMLPVLMLQHGDSAWYVFCATSYA